MPTNRAVSGKPKRPASAPRGRRARSLIAADQAPQIKTQGTEQKHEAVRRPAVAEARRAGSPTALRTDHAPPQAPSAPAALDKKPKRGATLQAKGKITVGQANRKRPGTDAAKLRARKSPPPMLLNAPVHAAQPQRFGEGVSLKTLVLP